MLSYHDKLLTVSPNPRKHILKMAVVDLSQNRALKIVSAAVKGGYAVPAICCYNLEAIIASVRAAEAKKSPVSRTQSIGEP